MQIYKPCDKNDVTMLSLPKTIENKEKIRTSLEPNKIYIVQMFWWELSKNVTFIEFETLCQTLWAFMSNFTTTTHNIWSCHVTLAANFENFYFSPNSILDFRKSYPKFGGNWLKNKKVTCKKKLGAEKHPLPSAYRVKGKKDLNRPLQEWNFLVFDCKALVFAWH